MKLERLENIAEIIAGQSPPSDSYNQSGDGLPFFQGKTDFGDMYPIARYWCKEPTKVALPKDILMSVRAPVGPVNICNIESCIGRGLSAIRVNENNSSEYVYYFLKTHENQIAKLGVGSTFKAITQKEIRGLKIPLPSLPDQIKIATVLLKAEALIKQRKESIALLDEFLKSTFLKMFGSIKRPQFVADEIENYSIKITDGTHLSPKFVSSGVPFLLVSNIVNNEINYDTKKFITEEDYLELNKRTPIEKGDILITSVGSYGNPALVKTITKFAFQRHIAYIKPDLSKINNIYLYGALKSDFVQMQIERVVRGIAQKTLNLSELRKLKIPIPPRELQNQFAQIVEKADALKTQYQQSLKELENLYGSLSQRAFRGELEIDTQKVISRLEAEIGEMEYSLSIGMQGLSEADDYGLVELFKKEINAITNAIENRKQLISKLKVNLSSSIDDYDSDHDRDAAIGNYLQHDGLYFDDLRNQLSQIIPSEIIFIEKKSSVTEIHTIKASVDSFESLYDLVEKFKGIKFIQNSANTIVNSAFISDFNPKKSYISLKNGLKFAVEDDFKESFYRQIGYHNRSNFLWENVSVQQACNWIKEEYSAYHFNIDMLIQFLKNERNIFPLYYSSEELKENPKLNEADDIKSLVFSAVSNENPFLKLEQLFYNAQTENFPLQLRVDDFDSIKNSTPNGRSGIYFKIIE